MILRYWYSLTDINWLIRYLVTQFFLPPKENQSWIFIGRTDTEAETPILWPPEVKNGLIGKTLKLGKIEGGRRRFDRGWDGWMASPTQWTWIWVNSGSWWWTGRPGVLWFTGSQRVGHERLNWTELNWTFLCDCENNFFLINNDLTWLHHTTTHFFHCL